MANEVEEVVNLIFSSNDNATGKKSSISTEDNSPASDQTYTIYPEALLHSTTNANKYYTALQSLTRQFTSDERSKNLKKSGEKHSGSIVQFSQSRLNALSRQKVQSWDDRDQTYDIDDSLLPGDTSKLANLGSSNTSSLFTWSSNDKYIAARKRELQRANTLSNDGNNNPDLRPVPFKSTKSPKTKRSPNSDLGFRLISVVESESNRFIRDRIEIIKAHHTQQASKKIDERKRKDHEMHLRRVQLKEEKYESILKEAIAMQNAKRNSGFFGSLFGPKSLSKSFTLQIPNIGATPRPLSPLVSNGYEPMKSHTSTTIPGPEVSPKRVSQDDTSKSIDEARDFNSVEDVLDVAQLEVHSSRSSTSSFEFEEFQSSTKRADTTNLQESVDSRFQIPSETETPSRNFEAEQLSDLASEGLTGNDTDSQSTTEDFHHDTTSDLVSL